MRPLRIVDDLIVRGDSTLRRGNNVEVAINENRVPNCLCVDNGLPRLLSADFELLARLDRNRSGDLGFLPRILCADAASQAPSHERVIDESLQPSDCDSCLPMRIGLLRARNVEDHRLCDRRRDH